MSVAPHPLINYTSNSSSKVIQAKTSASKKVTRRSNLGNKNQTRLPGDNLAILNVNNQPPIWLRSLLFLESGSKLLTLCIITVSLVLYGLTVNFPKRWTKEYNKLMNLERHERELIEKNEALKNQVATEAEQDDTMLSPDPTQAIFLKTTPVAIVSPTPQEAPMPQVMTFLGY